jgi:hypothetical protein
VVVLLWDEGQVVALVIAVAIVTMHWRLLLATEPPKGTPGLCCECDGRNQGSGKLNGTAVELGILAAGLIWMSVLVRTMFSKRRPNSVHSSSMYHCNTIFVLALGEGTYREDSCLRRHASASFFLWPIETVCAV